jgi:glucose-1-phosphate thymidylyltransferase
MKAILLVAGYATRMFPLTENQPKALLPLRGKPVLDYIMEQIYRLPSVDHIYVVSFFPHFSEWAEGWRGGDKPANARAAAATPPNGAAFLPVIPIKVLNDGTTANETRRGAIGDIQFTLEAGRVDDDIFVIAGDNYFTYNLREQYDAFRQTGCDTVCGKALNDREMLRAFAVAKLDDKGKVLELVEKPAEPASNIAVYASYFYRRDTLPLFKEYLAAGENPDPPGAFVQWLHTRKDVYAYKMNGECYDIGTITMYNALNG